jgi:signal transduction histidine kinase
VDAGGRPATSGGRWRAAGCAALLALATLCPAVARAADDVLAQAEALLPRDADQAERLAQQALATAREAQDEAAQAQALMLLGLVQMRRGQHAVAMQQLEAALPLAERGSDALRLGRVLASLGIVYDLSGLRSEALQVQQRALDLYLRRTDFARASALLINLGNTYDNQGDRAAARSSYERALAMKREHGIAKGLGSVLNNLADFELDAGRGERAVDLLREAIAAHRNDANTGAESLARSNLARALALTGRYDEATSELAAAAALAATANDALARLAADTARAQVLLTRVRAAPAGDPRRDGWLETSVAAAEQARAVARGLEDRGRLADLARLLADLRVEQGRHEAAVALLREAEQEQRADSSRADAERYAVLAARYRAEKQAGEIALLRQRESTQQSLLAEREATQRAELDRQRGWQVALAIAALGLALGVGLLWRHGRERQAHAARLEAGNRALAEALREAERLRARSEQVAAVNRRLLHLAGEEMRAPLLMLRGGAERLLVDDGSIESRARRVAAVAQATAELLRVADQMLESAALDPHAPPAVAPLALDRLLHDLVEQLHARAQARARELKLLHADAALVLADAPRLTLALQELLEQALAAAPSGSTVELDLRCSEGVATLCIGDPGAGLPENDAAGRRLAPSASGGLGYAWACEVIEGARGEVQRDSDGRGRRVLRVVLPCVAA